MSTVLHLGRSSLLRESNAASVTMATAPPSHLAGSSTVQRVSVRGVDRRRRTPCSATDWVREQVQPQARARCTRFGPAPVRHDVDRTPQIADAAPLNHATLRWLSGAEWAVQGSNLRPRAPSSAALVRSLCCPHRKQIGQPLVNLGTGASCSRLARTNDFKPINQRGPRGPFFRRFPTAEDGLLPMASVVDDPLAVPREHPDRTGLGHVGTSFEADNIPLRLPKRAAKARITAVLIACGYGPCACGALGDVRRPGLSVEKSPSSTTLRAKARQAPSTPRVEVGRFGASRWCEIRAGGKGETDALLRLFAGGGEARLEKRAFCGLPRVSLWTATNRVRASSSASTESVVGCRLRTP